LREVLEGEALAADVLAREVLPREVLGRELLAREVLDREALEREAHLVLAGREIQEAEFACLIGDRIRGPVTAGDCDRDTRQDAALLVGQRSRQRAAPELRESRCCRG